jgi:acylphosphatase
VDDQVCRRVVVAGDVQGVFFRDTCRRMARDAGVAGWVRNRSDGRVEACFEGERTQVQRLVDWCRQGPPRAAVEHIDVHDEPPSGLQGFRVR